MERSDERSSGSKEGVPLSGLIEGLRIDRDNSVECGAGVVLRLDPSEVPAHQLDRSQLARHDRCEEFRNCEFVELGVWQVSHDASSGGSLAREPQATPADSRRSGRALRSSRREVIPSFGYTLRRCHSTVRALMKSSAPISGLVEPSAAIRAI